MREEVEEALTDIDIRKKQNRRSLKGSLVIFGIVFAVVVILGIITGIVGRTGLEGVIIGILFAVGCVPTMIFFGGLYYYIRPYSLEERAFIQIVNAIKVLEKSTMPNAWEEAGICLKKALEILKQIKLASLGWYALTNRSLERFLDNFEYIILPTVSKAKFKKEDLETVGLAVLSNTQSSIEAVNGTLEKRDSYTKAKKPSEQRKPLLATLSGSQIVRVIVSLVLGYGLIFIICMFFAIVTQQDIITFMKGQPEIFILGGLGAAGITFWKTRSPS